jgi:hypothetical protein
VGSGQRLRYIEADPLGLVDGASVYGYVGQNPGRWTDRTGLCGFGDCVGGAAFLWRLYRAYRSGNAIGEAIAGTPGAAGTAAATSNSASSEGEEAKDRAAAETGEICDAREGCNPSESPFWTSLQPYRGPTKTNGLPGNGRRYYEWDYTHCDIEVYNKRGRHLGSANPKTGTIYKPAVAGRRIKL